MLLVIPQTGCIADITVGGKIGGCDSLKIDCICKNGSLLDGIACCLEKNCDASGKQEAVDYAKKICGAAGVKDIPTEVVCKKGAESTSSSSSGGKDEAKTTGKEAAKNTDAAQSPAATDSAKGSAGSKTSDGGSAQKTGDSGSKDEGGAASGLAASAGMLGAILAAVVAL